MFKCYENILIDEKKFIDENLFIEKAEDYA